MPAPFADDLRRFFNGEWVFLNAWDDCTAWAWIERIWPLLRARVRSPR